jgi:hypothetical protein
MFHIIIITKYKSKLFIGVLFPREGDRIPSILMAVLWHSGFCHRLESEDKLIKQYCLDILMLKDILCQKCPKIVDQEVQSSWFC